MRGNNLIFMVVFGTLSVFILAAANRFPSNPMEAIDTKRDRVKGGMCGMGLFGSRRMMAGSAIFTFLYLSTAGLAHATLKDAITAYRAGDYAEAFKGFHTLAKDGDRIAQYNIGAMYLTGRGVEKNPNEAVKWHRLAAEGGLPIAQYGLGVMYYRGDGVPEDLSEAAKWFRKAALQGYADAQFNLGVMYFNGQAVPRDMSEVVKWISLAAGKGHKDAMFRLATMYEQGRPFKSDPVEALHWYREAAANGHEEARARAEQLSAEVDASRLDETAAANPLAPVPVPTRGRGGTDDAATPGPLPNIPTTTIDQPDRSTGDSGEDATTADEEVATEGEAPPEGQTESEPARRVAVAPAASGWSVQLGSFRTVEEAQTAWKRLSGRHAGILGGFEATFRRVELNGRGVFHRLRFGPVADGAAAETLCAQLQRKFDGFPCLPVPPGKSDDVTN